MHVKPRFVLVVTGTGTIGVILRLTLSTGRFGLLKWLPPCGFAALGYLLGSPVSHFNLSL